MCVYGKRREAANEVIVCLFVVKGGGFIPACKKVREVLRVQAEINSSANLRIMVGFGGKKEMLARLLRNAQG